MTEEFKEFIKYARELEFEKKPDYKYLKELLIKAREKNGINIDKVKYDWVIKNEEVKEAKMRKIEEEKGKEMNDVNKNEKKKEKEENN